MSLPQPLMFTVGLIDQITKPIAKISQGLSGLASNYQAGTMQMASGIGGIAASGLGLYQALQPALEIDRALGDAKGVGVADSALKQITKTAMDFSLQFGKSSVDVINHAEKLRGVLGEMPDHVLASATNSSAVLAMAMKSDADTTSKYFKTLYGNYGSQANAMGQDKFIAQIAGMTAYAKKTLGTEMSDLEGMIDGMHSLPSTLGVALEEQFAVLATLNKSMGQGDAVTQYTNFLEGVAGAQEKLGVKLTDSKGNLLPMIDVIEKLKPMMQGMSGIQGRKFLDDAGLGDGSLMIINMMKNLDGLKSTIQGFKSVNGLDPALDMAKAMTVQSERLAESWKVIRAAFGMAILPAFNGFVSKIADMGTSVIWFTDMFPNITRWLGYVAVGFTAAVAAGGLFTVMMGAGKMAMTTWGLGVMAWTGANALFTSGLASMRAVLLAVNIAMYANPISLIVAGVAALIAVVGLAIYYFDDLRAMLAGTAWGEPILFAVDAIADLLKILGSVAVSAFSSWFDYLKIVWTVLKPVAGFLLDVLVFALKVVGAVAGAVFGAIAYAVGGLATLIGWLVNTISSGFEFAFNYVTDGWANVISALSSMEWVQGLISGASSVGEFFSQLWTSIKASFSDAWGWIVDNLNMLPGIDIAVNPVVEQVNAAQIPDVISQHNQQAVPSWMQQPAANDAVNYVYAAGNANAFAPAPFIPDAVKQQIDVQRTMPAPFVPATVTQQMAVQRTMPAPFVPEPVTQQIDVQRTMPAPYTPSPLTQQLNIEPTTSPALANVISPKFNQQVAARAQANRMGSQTANTGKTMSFGDVIIQNPPKNFSLAEIVDRQELAVG